MKSMTPKVNQNKLTAYGLPAEETGEKAFKPNLTGAHHIRTHGSHVQIGLGQTNPFQYSFNVTNKFINTAHPVNSYHETCDRASAYAEEQNPHHRNRFDFLTVGALGSASN